jgi:hypothetical protein
MSVRILEQFDLLKKGMVIVDVVLKLIEYLFVKL